jgi:hypothetical protein
VWGQPETYTYLALYWTWGPGKASDENGGGGPMAMLSRVRLPRIL